MSAKRASRSQSLIGPTDVQGSLFRYLTAASRLVPLAARYGYGQKLPGTEDAPARFLAEGLLRRAHAAGWTVGAEEGSSPEGLLRDDDAQHDRSCEDEMAPFHNASTLAKVLLDLSLRARRHAWLRDFTLTLGGDHGVAVGSIHGMTRAWANLGVVWVDAHADFNTPSTSASGNFHGMPLAALSGAFELSQVAGFQWFQSCLTPQDVVVVGARDMDAGEARLLAKRGMRMFSAKEVSRRGMAAVCKDAIGYLTAHGARPLHLSFDIDALDSAVAPGTGTPVADGLTLEDGVLLCETLRATGALVGMDLVEVNPSLEEPTCFEARAGEKTIACALALMLAALGRGPGE